MALKQEFLAHYQNESVRQQRLMALLGTALYALSGLLFTIRGGEVDPEPAFLAVSFVSPCLLVLAGLSLLDVYRRHNQRLVSGFLAAVLGGSGVAFVLLTPPAFDVYLRPVLVVLTFVIYTSLRLLWPYAVGLAICATLPQVLAATLSARWGQSELWATLALLVASNAIGFFTNYQLGSAAYRDFMQTRRLTDELAKAASGPLPRHHDRVG